tara:strand:+ start:575 stop:712 length:138 start_codon:yes stop_codon:yes gene_type:complete
MHAAPLSELKQPGCPLLSAKDELFEGRLGLCSRRVLNVAHTQERV